MALEWRPSRDRLAAHVREPISRRDVEQAGVRPKPPSVEHRPGRVLSEDGREVDGFLEGCCVAVGAA
jgi:hypothetical protein